MPEVKKSNLTSAPIVLSEDKVIRGKKTIAGTVLGIITCEKNFIVEDIDLAMQLSQIMIKKET